ncbi:HNH endonuclease [Tabrizicola sp. M-4]|uniref:HNH endonuclease n=1 Tax=Tabrizicola sp. M-4 TaxID=3055847 RepID=UPI003DA882DD
MGRLSALKGSIAPLPARLGYADDLQPDGRRARDKVQYWRRWYKTAQWQRLRWSVLQRDLFTCKRCGHVEGNTALLVADHKVPNSKAAITMTVAEHHALFHDPANLQCLCKGCHDSAKQAEEKAGRHRR